MKSPVRPELHTASVGSSQAPTAAVHNSAPLAIRTESSIYKSGNAVQTNGATSFFDRQRLQQEAPIRWTDLEEAGRVMGALLNDYSVDFDGTSYAWDTLNINDLDVLLRNAERGARSNAG